MKTKMPNHEIKVIVLKTDIHSNALVEKLSPVFDNHVAIRRWSIDLEDVDNVMRVEANPLLSHRDIQELIHMHGLNGEELKH